MFEIAYASTSGAASSGSGMTSILMIVVMLAIFYFLLIRPENKRKKQAEEMRSSLKKGDWITTIGGVYGRVVTITDRTVVIETSEDRVRVEFLKSAIGSVGTLEEQAAAAAAPVAARRLLPRLRTRLPLLRRPPLPRKPLPLRRTRLRNNPFINHNLPQYAETA